MASEPQRAPEPPAAPAAPIALGVPGLAPSLNVPANQTRNDGSDTQKKNGTTTTGLLQQGSAAPEGETTKTASGKELTPEQQAQLAKLQARDREVRAHEQAHAAAGGAAAGAPSYSYQTGPDGKQYAVGGEVPIRASASSGNPRQAIAQLQQVVRAATAPAQPSGQDRAVAAQAQAQIAQLQAQLAQESQTKTQEAMKGAGGDDAQSTDPAAKAPGLPALPDLPEIAPVGRPSGSGPAAPGEAASDRTPRSIVPARDAKSSNGETGAGGPIEIAQHAAGPIAAYQQRDGSNGKAAALVGRILSLNA
jgi:hypothetical protein